MTLSRPLVIALLGVIALVSFALAWVVFDLGRGGDMRDAEADFQARLRAGQFDRPLPAPPPSTAAAESSAGNEEAELAAWYAASEDPATPESGAAN